MFDVKTLIDLFWLKYAQLQHAVRSGEILLIDVLDGEIDPLLKAIENEQAETVADARLQFQFLLDLLQKEADDSSNVMRHSNALVRLTERYFVEAGTGHLMVRDVVEGAIPSSIRGRADEGYLNEAILDSLPDRVSVITPDYRYLYANALHAERLEERPMALVGRHVIEFVGIQSFAESLKPNLDKCFAGEALDYTYARDHGGRTVVVRCRMTPCRASMGQIIGAIVVLQEIADRRRAIAA
jgi:PAS domain-containing protein